MSSNGFETNILRTPLLLGTPASTVALGFLAIDVSYYSLPAVRTSRGDSSVLAASAAGWSSTNRSAALSSREVAARESMSRASTATTPPATASSMNAQSFRRTTTRKVTFNRKGDIVVQYMSHFMSRLLQMEDSRSMCHIIVVLQAWNRNQLSQLISTTTAAVSSALLMPVKKATNECKPGEYKFCFIYILYFFYA